MKEIRKLFKELNNKFRDIKYWIAHRTYSKYHIVKLGIKPGYQDVCHRMPIAVFELLNVFVEKEDGLKDYLEYKRGFHFNKEFNGHYEEWYRNVKPTYDALYKAYMWWKANKAEFLHNEFGYGENEEKKMKEMIEHLTNVIKYHRVLWT